MAPKARSVGRAELEAEKQAVAELKKKVEEGAKSLKEK